MSALLEQLLDYLGLEMAFRSRFDRPCVDSSDARSARRGPSSFRIFGHDQVPHRSTRRERGQATAEYALVLLGVAAIALLLAAWAAKSGKIGELFDAVVDQLITKAR